MPLAPVLNPVPGSFRRSDSAGVDVSVCIANWGCRELLQDCLESLICQPQGVRLEIIVVDNASTDGAADMVTDLSPEVTLIRNKTNQGYARANNQAAERARGRYLLFLNNDTWVPPETLGQLLDFAETHPEVGMIGPRLRNGRGEVQASYRYRPTLGTFLHRTRLLRATGLFRGLYRRCRRRDFDPATTRPVEVLMGAALFMPREVFFACGQWDEAFTFGGEDLDLSYRVGQYRPLVYYPEAEIIHHGQQSTRGNITFAAPNIIIGFLRYFRKTGSSALGLWIYKALVTLDAPVQLVIRGWQYLWRRWRNRPEEARKSLLLFRGARQFLLKGLIPFWKT